MRPVALQAKPYCISFITSRKHMCYPQHLILASRACCILWYCRQLKNCRRPFSKEHLAFCSVWCLRLMVHLLHSSYFVIAICANKPCSTDKEYMLLFFLIHFFFFFFFLEFSLILVVIHHMSRFIIAYCV